MARILLEKTLCMRGLAAAQLCYDNERFTRVNAMPARVQKTLFGVGGVQDLHGQAHHHRKAMFLSVMSDEQIR